MNFLVVILRFLGSYMGPNPMGIGLWVFLGGFVAVIGVLDFDVREQF
jgi:hypothetical protein